LRPGIRFTAYFGRNTGLST